jgi:alanine dehydrogenase
MPHIDAMRAVFGLTHVFCWDRDPRRAEALAARSAEAGLPMQFVDDLGTATRSSDIIVTCTTASRPFLAPDMVRLGTFIAAVGADHPAKSEIDPKLMAKARVVTDSTDQCLSGGDLLHAVRAGTMQPSDVHGELGALLCGDRHGRTDPDAIFLFDSTGTAIQDVASAALIYERAVARGVGTAISFTA